MDLDLRKIRYFDAVVRHGHFGRAAEELFIAQPVLSRQIRALERELGCELLERTTRTVQLTAAGHQLATEAPGLLQEAASVERRTRRAARGLGLLVVGFAPGLSIAPVVAAYTPTHSEVEVRLEALPWHSQADAVRNGLVDVGYVRDVSDDDQLRTVTVGAEAHCVVVPHDHTLATRGAVRPEDLEGLPRLTLDARRGATAEEKFERVAAGEGVAIVPESVARYYARPGLVHRPLLDGIARSLVIAVRTDRTEQHIHEFVDIAIAELSEKRKPHPPLSLAG